jgi:heptosyltransferase-1
VNEPFRRILLIKPSSLGDIIHALPVLAAIRRSWPQAHVAWLVGSNFASLLAEHPMLDEVIAFDRERFGRMWRNPSIFAEFWRFVGQIRGRRFDLVIDLQGLMRSAILSYFGGVPTRVGFADAREGAWLFYNRRVRCPAQAEHAVQKNLHLAQTLGLAVEPVEFPLPVSAGERREADELLTAAAGVPMSGITAVVVGARWESKLWPAARFAELIDRVHADGGPRCVLLGAAADRGLASAVADACRGERPVDLVGRTTLRQLVALLERAEQVICLDSGPMHIAAALNKPLVSLFGPTNPERTGPYSPEARVVRVPLPCSPCYRRTCPLGHHNCMQKLAVDQVLTCVRKPARPVVTAHD